MVRTKQGMESIYRNTPIYMRHWRDRKQSGSVVVAYASYGAGDIEWQFYFQLQV